MFRAITIALCLLMSATAEMMLPTVDLRIAETPPLITTWAHAGARAAIRVESPGHIVPICDLYQVSAGLTLALSRNMLLKEIKPGPNLLEVPLPEALERGKLLVTISDSEKDDLIVNLAVNILPKDALESLAKHSELGRVWIDPKFKVFRSWATSHGISITEPTPGTPAEFHFGMPAGNPNLPAPGRMLIYERDEADALCVIEVISSPKVTKIILPQGFLEMLPASANAEALLLTHMDLLP